MRNLTARQLSRLVLKGYNSIAECDIELKPLNILIGANGAGKSNFLSFFKMIRQMLEGNLQRYVGSQGGPDAILHFGRKKTEQLIAELYFGNNGYKFSLEPTKDNRLMFAKENFWWKGDWFINSGHFESETESTKSKTRIYDYTVIGSMMRRSNSCAKNVVWRLHLNISMTARQLLPPSALSVTVPHTKRSCMVHSLPWTSGWM